MHSLCAVIVAACAFQGPVPSADVPGELVFQPDVGAIKSVTLSDAREAVAVVRRAPNGNLWLTGTTRRADSKSRDGEDVFVRELDPSGETVLFSAVVGGSRSDFPSDMAIVGDGDVVVCGRTSSLDFPATSRSGSMVVQPSYGGGAHDAFVFRMDDAGILEFSTFLGGAGDDGAVAIGLLSGNDIAIAGSTSSSDFPTFATAQSALRGTSDGFAARIAAAGDALHWSTYVGADVARDLAVDRRDDSLVVAGAANHRMHVERIAADGSARGACDLGDNSRQSVVTAIALLDDGRIAVAGETDDPNLALDGQAGHGDVDALLCVWDASLTSLEFATFVASHGRDACIDLAVRDDRAYLLLQPAADDLPVVQSMGSPAPGVAHGYVACVDLAATPIAIEWASYLPSASDIFPASLEVAPAAGGALFIAGKSIRTEFASDAATRTRARELGVDRRPEGFVMRIDDGWMPGSGIAGFAADASVATGAQLAFCVERHSGVAEPRNLHFELTRAGVAIPGHGGDVALAAGECIATGVLDLADVDLTGEDLALVLTATDGGAIDPAHQSMNLTADEPPYQPPGSGAPGISISSSKGDNGGGACLFG